MAQRFCPPLVSCRTIIVTLVSCRTVRCRSNWELDLRCSEALRAANLLVCSWTQCRLSKLPDNRILNIASIAKFLSAIDLGSCLRIVSDVVANKLSSPPAIPAPKAEGQAFDCFCNCWVQDFPLTFYQWKAPLSWWLRYFCSGDVCWVKHRARTNIQTTRSIGVLFVTLELVIVIFEPCK